MLTWHSYIQGALTTPDYSLNYNTLMMTEGVLIFLLHQVKGFMVNLRVSRQLGTCVARSANFGLGQAVIAGLAVAEVSDLDEWLGRGVQQCVLQLDVPVDHTHAMAVVQSHNQLLEEPTSVLLLHASSFSGRKLSNSFKMYHLCRGVGQRVWR